MTGAAASFPREVAVGRPAKGTVIRKKTELGTSYAVRVPFRGGKEFVRLGGSWEGWTEERVQDELDYILGQIRRGEWIPPQRDEAVPTDLEHWRFRDVAAVYLARQATRLDRGTNGKTYRDLEWRLAVAVDHIGDLAVEAVGEAQLDEMVLALLRERERIEEAAARGEPEYEDYTDSRTGKVHQRRARGLARSSINKVLTAVERVLREAKRRNLIDQVPDTSEVRVRSERPRRPYLELAQAVALIDAASAIEEKHRGLSWDDVYVMRESSESNIALARRFHVTEALVRKIRRGEVWTREATRRRNDIPRTALVATLVLAGVRISELCAMDREHLDLPGCRLRVPRVKTDASERVVPLAPRLREILLDHAATLGPDPKAPLFPNRNGGRQTPDNVRTRILGPAGEAIGEHVTPHMLRRTFASLLAELGVPPRRAMYLLGHTNPTLTMSVYQQVLDVAAPDLERTLESLLGCDAASGFEVFAGRQDWSRAALTGRAQLRGASARRS
jgi:integrase